MEKDLLAAAEDGRLKQYEELLLKKDRLTVEANNWLCAYLRTFGNEMEELFEQKIACIEAKKAIAFCQREQNAGRAVDPEQLQRELDTAMSAYYEQLAAMKMDVIKAKDVHHVTDYDLQRSKAVYRRIAKRLHPDRNPAVSGHKELSDLWQRVQDAYRLGDAEALEELEVLAEAALDAAGLGGILPPVPDVEERIMKLQAETEQILTTAPYVYRFLLEDPEATEEKHRELRSETAEYRAYYKKLKEVLASFGIEEEEPCLLS